MVKGLDLFRDHFKGFENRYILIGGTACDLWMGQYGLAFRPTEDLDVVLLFDTVDDEFVTVFWKFMRASGYGINRRSDGTPTFYRFSEPNNPDYPRQIELLSRNELDLPEDAHLTPIPAGEDLSSLSAILVDDNYYDFIFGARIRVDGVATVPVQCLVPLKAKAFLDLSARKDAGHAAVRSTDIKKHRNDVFTLLQTLAPDERFDLPEPLKDDLRAFLAKLPADSADWRAIDQSVRHVLGSAYAIDPAEATQQLTDTFQL